MKYSVVLLLLMVSCAPKESILPIEEYEKFGNRMVSYFRAEKEDGIINEYNPIPAFEKVKIEYLKSGNGSLEGSATRVRLKLIQNFRFLIETVINSSSDSSKFELSRTYFSKKIPHIVVALRNDKGYNFIDFELLSIGEHIYIVDAYNYVGGELLSNFVIESQLNSVTPYYNIAQKELRNAQGYLKGKQYDRAWVVFNRIDYEFQYGKPFQETKLLIARHLSDSLYFESFYNFIGAYYDEDQFRIMKSFVFYYESGETEKATLTLDTLTNLVGNNFVIKELKSKLKNAETR